MRAASILPVISMTDDTWRAVRLQNLESVDYLNRLFQEGWHLMHIGADGLEYLAFEVPLEVPTWTKIRSVHHRLDLRKEPSTTILVLRSGTVSGLQRALVLERDERGRIDMGQLPPDGFEWLYVLIGLSLDSGEQIAILQKTAP